MRIRQIVPKLRQFAEAAQPSDVKLHMNRHVQLFELNHKYQQVQLSLECGVCKDLMVESYQERVSETDAGIQGAHEGGVTRLAHSQAHLAIHTLHPPAIILVLGYQHKPA